ncbi:MAG: HAD-IA family hydrolase [Muribaculaceae bacterium]|nr:HAD-IA family hydrolase [Muribaculaceae bacterium]
MTHQEAIANYKRYSGNRTINITTALIDMDGVLYDSMKNHTRAWVKLAKKNGVKCTRDEFYLYEGMRGTDIIKMLFKRGLGRNVTEDEARALYLVKGRYFTELGEVEKIEGAQDMLTALRDSQVERVLVTGSAQQSILDRLDEDYAGLLSPTRVTAYDTRFGKPNPEPYLKAMEKTGAKPSQCLVIENAPLGVQAGHAAGCFTIAVTTGPIPAKELYKAGADLVYGSMSEFAADVPALIQDLNNNE